MRRTVLALVVVLLAILVAGSRGDRARVAAEPSQPIVDVETSRGHLAIELFMDETPYAVVHILKLVNAGFYDGQRVHRALPGFVVQFGDPQSRDLSLRSRWGRGAAAGSGDPIGIAEMNLPRTHAALSVGLAHLGDPKRADSQLYITLAPRPDLDGQYAVIGRVIEGDDVPGRLQVGDSIVHVTQRH